MWNLKTHLILGLQGGVDGCTNLWSVNNFPPKRHIGIQTLDLNSNTTPGTSNTINSFKTITVRKETYFNFIVYSYESPRHSNIRRVDGHNQPPICP